MAAPAASASFATCPACRELLAAPVTLPCGAAVCRCCLHARLAPASSHYACPAPACGRTHGFRFDRVDRTLLAIVERSFPAHARAAALADEYDSAGPTAPPPPRRKRPAADHDDMSADHAAKVARTIGRAVALCPRNAALLARRAQAYAAAGDFQRAAADARRSLELAPDSPLAQAAAAADYDRRGSSHSNVAPAPLLRRSPRRRRLDGAAAAVATESSGNDEEEAGDNRQHVSDDDQQQQEPSSPESPTTTTIPSPADDSITVPPALLECALCFNTFDEPVTAPCGHTFCRACIVSALDHAPTCPLCRMFTPPVAYFVHRPVNKVLASLLPPPQQQQNPQPQRHPLAPQEKWTPIFVCSLVLPREPYLLHIFEPRYRVLVRRAMRADRAFGVCLPGAEFGTMVRIRECAAIDDEQLVATAEGELPRYYVDTVGTHRFRVLEQRVCADGYVEARVQRVEDDDPDGVVEGVFDHRIAGGGDVKPAETDKVKSDVGGSGASETKEDQDQKQPSSTAVPTTPAQQQPPSQRSKLNLDAINSHTPPVPAPAEPEFIHLHTEVRAVAPVEAVCKLLLAQLSSAQKQRIEATYGRMPRCVNFLSFWMAHLVPVGERAKYELLGMTDPRLRVQKLMGWLNARRGGAAAGCIIA